MRFLDLVNGEVAVFPGRAASGKPAKELKDAKRAALLPRISSAGYVVLHGQHRRQYHRRVGVQRMLDVALLAKDADSTAQPSAGLLVAARVEQTGQGFALGEVARVWLDPGANHRAGDLVQRPIDTWTCPQQPPAI